jgi:hypothetical protein
MDDRIDVAAIFGIPSSSSATVLASVTAHYAALPSSFKVFAPLSGDRTRDIFGFQAANIQATLLLLRMLFSCTDDHNTSDVQSKCDVAAELLAVFQAIPGAYLCGISTPLIYHLAGIAMMLGSVMEGPLSENAYQKVRAILLSIADLLETLESGLSRAADINKGLRTQVERIDDYMRLRSTQHFDAGMNAVGVGNSQVEEAEGAGAESQGQFVPGWMGELQLPPELLEDWSWPFNLQPDSWSFLGTGVGAKEGGW